MKNNSKLNLIIAMLALTTFVLGLVTGLFIMHFSKRDEPKAEEMQPVIPVEDEPEIPNVVVLNDEPEEEEHITNVYIPKRERVFGQIPVNSYNTENFVIEDGFMAYYDDNGEKISHLGVDLSYHQEKIDWEKLKDSGIEFVMLRCGYRGYTEGGLVEDERFREYATACNEYDIPLGVYFFTQSVSEEEAREEAHFVLDLIKDYKISYPVALDSELVTEKGARTNTDDIDEDLRTKMCLAFLEEIKNAGYYPMLYASENWMRRSLIAEELQEYDLWAPQYLDENDFMYDFTIWQYTERGYISGVDEQVDLNISMVDYASFVPAMNDARESGGEIIEQ